MLESLARPTRFLQYVPRQPADAHVRWTRQRTPSSVQRRRVTSELRRLALRPRRTGSEGKALHLPFAAVPRPTCLGCWSKGDVAQAKVPADTSAGVRRVSYSDDGPIARHLTAARLACLLSRYRFQSRHRRRNFSEAPLHCKALPNTHYGLCVQPPNGRQLTTWEPVAKQEHVGFQHPGKRHVRQFKLRAITSTQPR